MEGEAQEPDTFLPPPEKQVLETEIIPPMGEQAEDLPMEGETPESPGPEDEATILAETRGEEWASNEKKLDSFSEEELLEKLLEEADLEEEEEEEEWATSENDLKEIDLDHDPELAGLEEAEEEADTIQNPATMAPEPDQEEKLDAATVDEELQKPPPGEALKDPGPLMPGMMAQETPRQASVKKAKEEEPAKAETLQEENEAPPPPPEEEEVWQKPEEEAYPEEKKDDLFVSPILAKPFANEEESFSEDEEEPKKKSSKKLWVLAALLLLTSSLGFLFRSEWAERAWFDLSSPYQLLPIESQWREHSFGTLLVMKGTVGNNSSRSSPPLVQVSLMNKENKTLLSTHVVPGRIISAKILADSSEQAIREMIALQSKKQTKAELTWPDKEIPFQIMFINPPEEAVHFQVDFK